MANINDFKSLMLGGGARPNQFRVILSFPADLSISTGVFAAKKAEFLCSATSLPGSSISNVAVAYRGRTVNFAGERSFQPWNVTVYTDVDFDIRNAMEEWQGKVQNYAATNGVTNPVSYQSDMRVEQLDRNGAVLKTYIFKDAFPTVIDAIQLNYASDNQIESFGITFQYNYFTSESTDQDNSRTS
jgi:hypothetical protein